MSRTVAIDSRHTLHPAPGGVTVRETGARGVRDSVRAYPTGAAALAAVIAGTVVYGPWRAKA